MSTPSERHQRYRIQAGWTSSVRHRLYQRAELAKAQRVLDVGCGTGVITSELAALARGGVYGLDIDRSVLSFVRSERVPGQYIVGDAIALPHAGDTFDVVVCHFLLLWVREVERALGEMVRVTTPGGLVMALAEPDYGGRLDYPQPLEQAGELQTQALQDQGSDPFMGRKLRALFSQAGLVDVLAGVLGGEWRGAPEPDALASEWETLASDLKGMMSDEELAALRRQDQKAWRDGSRVLFVPTFYAMGRVPPRRL